MSRNTLIDLDYPIAGAPLAAVPPAPRGLAPLIVRPTNYDPRSALPPGLLLTRDAEAALLAAWQANAYAPLTPGQAINAVGAGPVFPASLPCLDCDTCTGSWRDRYRCAA